MVLTQKVVSISTSDVIGGNKALISFFSSQTSLAFSLHDGVARKPEELTPFQKQQVIRKVPNPLEYYSYVLHFHAVMVGPSILFADYIDFINGKHFAKRNSV